MMQRGLSEGLRGSLVLVAWLVLGGCGGSSKAPATPKCYLASDCKDPLQCVQGYCVAKCVQSRDCPSGQRCIAAAEGNTCQPPETVTCQYTSQCTTPLVCAFDQQCRNQCQTNIDCPASQVCTSVTHLCADPTIDKATYDPVTNEFVAAHDGGAGSTGDSGAGRDAASTNPGADSGASSGADGSAAGLDVPVTNPGDSGFGSDGSGGNSGDAGGRDAGIAGASGTACSAGQTPTKFKYPAMSVPNPHYTSGVGVLTATELLTFSGYAGPDSPDGGVVDSGTLPLVNRIDVQHFDPTSGKPNGSVTPLLTAAGDGSGIYIAGAAVAPTGEIAIIYSAATGGGSWSYYGVYLAFFGKDLAPSQTTLFVVQGSSVNQDQSYVQWLNGEFVASSIFFSPGYTIKVGRFGADGSNLGITRALPTDDPSGFVWDAHVAQGEVAFSGNTFAAAYSTTASGPGPSLTFVDASDAISEVGRPVTPLPSATNNSVFAVAGTSEGFVALYNGTSALSGQSLVATYVSNSASAGDAGVPVGATYAFLGGFAYQSARSTRGSSAGTAAGFAALYPDGSVSFLYFSADGSAHGNPQTVLQQMNNAGGGDETHITSYAGKFVVSLYSDAEHLTRVITSTCQ